MIIVMRVTTREFSLYHRPDIQNLEKLKTIATKLIFKNTVVEINVYIEKLLLNFLTLFNYFLS